MLRGCPSMTLSFLDTGGQVHQASGLNWWNARGRRRDPDEANIPLPVAKLADVRRVLGTDAKGTKFIAILHDGTLMRMQLEGNRTKGDPRAKQIASNGPKRIFGNWILRQMLGIPAGQLVTVADLNNYGRTNIVFRLIGSHPTNGQPIVYVDFS